MSTDYNGAAWTASDLLAEVYRACRMPDTGTVDYTPSVVLRMASDAIWNWAGHQVGMARGGRGLTELVRFAVESSISVDGSRFELPPMALADTVDSVQWVDGSGDVRDLAVIPANMLPLFTQSSETGEPTGYTLRDGTVQVFPPPTAGSIRINFQRRHGDLVVGSDTATVGSVVSFGGSAQVTMSTAPAGWVAGTWLDIQGASYPYRTKIAGARIISVAGAAEYILSTSYADWIAAAVASDTAVTYGKTPYVSLPLEMRSSLTQHIAANILAELGDGAMAQLYEGRADAGAARTRDLLSPRTKADRPKVTNPNSLARGAAARRRSRTDSF